MATPTITDTKKQEDNSHQVTGEAPAVVGAVTVPSRVWPAEVTMLTEGVAEAVAEIEANEGCGYWQSCSGCHETNEGHETGWYPYSEIFKCYLGSGCHECGGIGVVWDYYTTEMLADLRVEAMRDDRVTADVPSTLGAGGSLEDDLTSSSEISRLKQALEEIANLPVGGNPVGFYTAAQNMKATAREALTSTPLEKTDGK